MFLSLLSMKYSILLQNHNLLLDSIGKLLSPIININHKLFDNSFRCLFGVLLNSLRVKDPLVGSRTSFRFMKFFVIFKMNHKKSKLCKNFLSEEINAMLCYASSSNASPGYQMIASLNDTYAECIAWLSNGSFVECIV